MGGGVATQGAWSRRLYLPAYRYADAARLVQTTAPTISRWYRGYEAPGHRMKPVLLSDGTPLLSYLQLVEVAFVATFRQRGVKLNALRQAHHYCRSVFGKEYPFAELEFKTDGHHVLWELAENDEGWAPEAKLVLTDVGGQVVWKDAGFERLDQFDYQEGRALRWHPRGRTSVMLIDPRIAFGAPVIEESGLPTAVLAERFKAGETLWMLHLHQRSTQSVGYGARIGEVLGRATGDRCLRAAPVHVQHPP